MPTHLDKKRKIMACRKAAQMMSRKNAHVTSDKVKSKVAPVAKMKQSIVSNAIEEPMSDDDDYMSTMMQKHMPVAKKQKKETAPDANSASAWFEQMAKQIDPVGDSKTKKPKKSKKQATESSISVDELANAEVVDADMIAERYLQSSVLLSDRTDLWDARKERQRLAEEAKKRPNDAHARLQRKLASLDKDETGDAPGGQDFLAKVLKESTGTMDWSDDEDMDEGVRAPVRPEDRYLVDGSAIGTSTDFDDFHTVLSNIPDETVEQRAKRARVVHEMLVCGSQDEKCAAAREVVDAIRAAEEKSRVKTVTLVFVKENKTAVWLHARLGLQINKHIRNKKGMSGGGTELRTQGVEFMHMALKDWEMERSYIRVRSGRCRVLVLTEPCITKVWQLRHKFGRCIHFDLPDDNFLSTYLQRVRMMNRKTDAFPSNETTTASGAPVSTNALANRSLMMLSRNRLSRAFAEAVLPTILENGQVRVVQALQAFIDEGKVKKRKFM